MFYFSLMCIEMLIFSFLCGSDGKKKNLPMMQKTWVPFLSQEDPLEKGMAIPSSKLWKILKEMGIPDHLICLLRNLYAAQEATVRTGHGTTDWFQIGKGVRQGCILSPSLFNLYKPISFLLFTCLLFLFTPKLKTWGYFLIIKVIYSH